MSTLFDSELLNFLTETKGFVHYTMSQEYYTERTNFLKRT